METTTNCPRCNGTIDQADKFCKNCGSEINQNEKTTSTSRQLVIYAVSFFLAPFGLIPAIKYLAKKDPKEKRIGWIALGLTVFAIIITILISVRLTQYLGDMYSRIGSGTYY